MATSAKKQTGPVTSSQVKKCNTTESTAAARRAKKREQDRQCQQRARQRTRDRIVYLEKMVQNLKQQNTTKAMEDVWRQRDEIAAQRDALAETLRVIERALQTSKNDISLPSLNVEHESGNPSKRLRSDSSDSDTLTGSVDGQSYHADRQQSAAEQNADSIDDSGNQPSVEDHATMVAVAQLDQQIMKARRPRVITHPLLQDPIIPHPQHSCACSPAASSMPSDRRGVNYWRFVNEVLQPPVPTTPDEKIKEEDLEHDAPVRAMLEGWNAVEQRAGGELPPSWQQLRQVDETVFSGLLSKTERLAIMRVMHCLFRFHQERSLEKLAKLPTWHLARPSQEIAHSYAIDYFAWPGFRERFVFHQHRYCSNRFWLHFCKHLRVLWPFEFRDCYSRNVFTGEYKISPAFLERTQDIRAWTMAQGMFELYPEFHSDIPKFDPSIASLVFKMPTQEAEAADEANDEDHATRQIENGQTDDTSVIKVPFAAPDDAATSVNGNNMSMGQMPDTLNAVQDHYLLTSDIWQSFNDFGDFMYPSTGISV